MLNTLFNFYPSEREDGLIPVAKLTELSTGRLKRIIVKGQPVLLTLAGKVDGTQGVDVVAFSSICPHALGDLSQGWLHQNEIECPVHYYRLNVRTGECAYPNGGPKLRMYPVTIEGNQILLKIVPPRWMDQSDD
jgi:nitrite reductase/ring-hydroxylating ferredoxin subunit